jgi:hypothetical protein
VNPRPPRTWSVRIDAWADVLLGVLLTAQGILLLLDILFTYLDLAGHRTINRLFNLAHEKGIGTWFASTQMLLVGVTALLLGAAVHGRGGPKWTARAWTAAGVFFVLLSIDDALEIHERIGPMLRNLAGAVDLPSYAWQFFVLPVFGVAGLLILWFLHRQLTPHRLLRWVIAGFACWSVAIGLDFVEGIDKRTGLYEEWADGTNLAFASAPPPEPPPSGPNPA